jgi:hypothetical protein
MGGLLDPEAWAEAGRRAKGLLAEKYDEAMGILGHPRAVYEGKADPYDPGMALGMAGMAMTGGIGGAPAGAIGSGPIRAYHGSPNDFNAFDMARAGSTTDPGALGRGHYFSDDARTMGTYPHKYEADLNLSNPLELEMPDFKTRKVDVISRALGIDPPKTRDEMAEWSRKVASLVRERGHDSVILDNSPTGYKGREIAVFDDSLINVLSKDGNPLR